MTTAHCLFRSAQDRFDRGDFRPAFELAFAGLQREPYHAGLLQVYGVSAYHLGEWSAALEGLETASMVVPLEPFSQVTLADLYVRSQNPKSARTILRFLIEPGRCPTPLLPDVARLLGALGAYRSAFKVCRRLIAARPWYHPAHYGAAFYLTKLNRPAVRIIRHLRAAHELVPDAIPYRVALAGELGRIGRHEETCALIRDVPVGAITCPGCLKRFLASAEATGDAELALGLRAALRALDGGRETDCAG